MRLNPKLRLELALPNLTLRQFLPALPILFSELFGGGLTVPIAHLNNEDNNIEIQLGYYV